MLKCAIHLSWNMEQGMSVRIIPTILCGGAGSRLWPISRELHPKPFIRLTDGESLLQKTFIRCSSLPYVEEILTVTYRELFFKIEDEYREINHDKLATSFILEPFSRNTASAVVAAALQIQQIHGEESILLILPADHLIANQQAFCKAVEQAVELAKNGRLVTFGIQPDRPETGYGYIKAEGNHVVRFVEKPTLEEAKEFLKTDSFLWNSGMLCFMAGTLLKEMECYAPDIYFATKTCVENSQLATGKGFSQLELEAESFLKVPENSIDYALIEKSQNLAVVPCDLGWSDVGSWGAFGDLAKTDTHGNCVEGETLLHDVTDCYIRSPDRLVAAIGIDHLFIIDTPDALLIADKSRDQEVKNIYTQLKKKGHEAYKLHRIVHRPWGTYTVLEEGPRFKIKRIVVKPGASLSLQMHHHRSEHWVVVKGMAKVINGEKELLVNTNESTYIPAGHKHRLENPGVLDLVMIEVQSGEYMGEDDIVRFQDAYGRV